MCLIQGPPLAPISLFKEKFIPNEGSINSFLKLQNFDGGSEGLAKMKSLPSCFSLLVQEIIVPHLMNCNIWVVV